MVLCPCRPSSSNFSQDQDTIQVSIQHVTAESRDPAASSSSSSAFTSSVSYFMSKGVEKLEVGISKMDQGCAGVARIG